MSTTAPAGIAWDELHSKDRDKAEAFYNTLFGWTSTPVAMSPEYTYHLLNRADNGQMFAGSHQQGDEEKDVPSYWLVCLGTSDVDKAEWNFRPLLGIIPAIIALGVMLALHESRPKEPQPD